MSFFVNGPDPCRADVRVDLGRDETFVAQQLLDAADVSTGIQQVSCETVAQGVRGGLQVQTG